MSAFPNPLTGAGWAGQAPGQQQQSPVQPPWLSGPINLNPGGYSNPRGPNEINRNLGLENISAAGQKNLLAPFFAQLMQQYGGQAGDFFKNLTNLGSPYYQQKQQEAFTQGNKANQDAAAMARQQQQAQGYGSTPSGAGAAMIGGMNQAGGQSLAEQYLQNLFQNEQMQMAGAQGLSGLAQLFNPNQLLSGTSVGANIQAQPSFFQNFATMMNAIKPSGSYTPGQGFSGRVGGGS